MSHLRSHPLYAATTAFLNRVQGNAPQTPGGSTNRPGGSTAKAVAASGLSDFAAVDSSYWRVCRPFRPCPQGWPAGYATIPIQAAGAAASFGGSIGGAIGISGATSQGVVEASAGSVIQPAFADTMRNSELDRYWKIWNDNGDSIEDNVGFTLKAKDLLPPVPAGLCAYIGATFTDSVTEARLLSDPANVSGGVFARASFNAGTLMFNGYVLYEDVTEYVLVKVVNNVATFLGSAVVQPTINDLVAIQCAGTTIAVRINGVLELSVPDATFASGYSGLSVYNTEFSQMFGDVAIAG